MTLRIKYELLQLTQILSKKNLIHLNLNNELKFEIRRNNEQIAELNDLKDRLNEDLNA